MTTVPNAIMEEPPRVESHHSIGPTPLDPPDRSNRNRKVLIVAALAALVLTSFYFFVLRNRAAGSTALERDSAAAAPTTVSTAVAAVREIPTYIEASGSLIAFESTDVAPLVPGKITETPINEGRFVRRGDVIARMDDRDAKLRVQQAEAAVRQAEAAVKQAKETLGMSAGASNPTLVAEVESARATWQLAAVNERRYANLLKSGDVSQAQYDEFKARADTARTAYDAALAKAKSGWASVDVQESALQSAVAARDIAKKALNDTVIVAPLDGYVAERPTAVGEWVTTSSRIVTIVQSDRLKLLLQVSESDASRVKVGMSASVKVDAFADRTFSGSVATIIPALDPSARALIAVVVVPNGEGLLKPGMFGTAKVLESAATVRSVVVPKDAVVRLPSGASIVYVVSGGRAVAHPVQIGQSIEDFVQIISGVDEGADVVTAGAGSLTDGTAIVPSTR